MFDDSTCWNEYIIDNLTAIFPHEDTDSIKEFAWVWALEGGGVGLPEKFTLII